MVDEPSENSEAALALSRAGLQMGTLVSFSADDGAGWIESEDGDLYFFSAADIISHTDMPVGASVRFRGAEGLATEVDHATAVMTQPAAEPGPVPEATAQDADADNVPPEPDEPSPRQERGAVTTVASASEVQLEAAVPDTPMAAQGTAQRHSDDSVKSGASDHSAPLPGKSNATPGPPNQIPSKQEASSPKAPARQTLRGQLVSYEPEGGSGWIQGVDSNKLYGFGKGDALDPTTLVIGQGVFFHSFDNVTATCVVSVARGEDPQEAMATARAAAKAREAAQQSSRRRAPQAHDRSLPGAFFRSRGIKFAVAAGIMIASVAAYFVWDRLSAPSAQNTGATEVAAVPDEVFNRDSVTQGPAESAAGAVEEAPATELQVAADDAASVAEGPESGTLESDAAPAVERNEVPSESGPSAAPNDLATRGPAPPETETRPAGESQESGAITQADLPTPEPLAAETEQPLPGVESPRVTTDAPLVAVPAPSRPPAQREPASTSSDTLSSADLPLPRAPEKGEPLTAWWQDPLEGELNLNFAGHLSSRPAIVLAFDGIFTGREAFDTFISVTDASGEPMRGRWEVGPNRTSLILPVPPGRYYVSIGAGLEDNRGRKLGRRLGGVLRIL